MSKNIENKWAVFEFTVRGQSENEKLRYCVSAPYWTSEDAESLAACDVWAHNFETTLRVYGDDFFQAVEEGVVLVKRLVRDRVEEGTVLLWPNGKLLEFS